MEYPVLWNEKPVGTAYLTRKGLYWDVFCKCQLPARKFFRLQAAENGAKEDLGVLVPEGGGYTLKKMIAVKRIGEKPESFSVTDHSSDSMFIPIDADKPFDYLHKLNCSKFEILGGVPGLRIERSHG